ncbi:uncharacterized protein F4812DRAFT_457938 [Daldinia caldariorum]|uniref:uncharacterized protein n=1 Tax=Daldinia caldariorum TaxID=326644 RepID=UPI002007D4DE|nr:uncharacterized protein F4812DRAFT_457938 [Daldinia caldariorum]KAI1469400.1 hypothetical protein F4812DRAFT_457938 [Daldinia caldariorum]
MPQDLSSIDREIPSHLSEVTNDSTRTERGSPVPDLPDVPEPNDAPADTQGYQSNIDQDLLGFGAQFDDKK